MSIVYVEVVATDGKKKLRGEVMGGGIFVSAEDGDDGTVVMLELSAADIREWMARMAMLLAIVDGARP